MQSNSPIQWVSNPETKLGLFSQEFVQKLTEVVFPEIVDISRSSEPEIRDGCVRRLEQRLLAEAAARREHDERKSFSGHSVQCSKQPIL